MLWLYWWKLFFTLSDKKWIILVVWNLLGCSKCPKGFLLQPQGPKKPSKRLLVYCFHKRKKKNKNRVLQRHYGVYEHLSFCGNLHVACKLRELWADQISPYFSKILYGEQGDLRSKSLPAVGRKIVYSHKDRSWRDFVKLVGRPV